MAVNKNYRKGIKIIIAPIIVAAVIVAIFIVSFIYYYRHTTINDGTLTNSDSRIVYQIDSVIEDKDTVYISGWCFIKEESTSPGQRAALRLILVDTKDQANRKYLTAMHHIYRPEVGDYFNNETYDYSYCGFEATVSIDTLDLANTVYEIAIQPNEREPAAVQTKIFLDAEGTKYVDPDIYVPLDVEGTALEDIVKKGYVKAYRPDVGLYAYQYDQKIYWIADENYPFDQGWNYFSCLVSTTTPSKLPSERVEGGWDFDNIGWKFNDAEVTETGNYGKYRVSVCEIPEEYAIAGITTGFYKDEKWLWWERFMPEYTFTE